jgi:hypothetical protein
MNINKEIHCLIRRAHLSQPPKVNAVQFYLSKLSLTLAQARMASLPDALPVV